MSRIVATGRVERHTDTGVVLALDRAAGWDIADRLTSIALPRNHHVAAQPFDGPSLPPVGSHVTLTLYWKP